jgi:MFS family permease
LYALLFVDTGLSDAQISILFAIWSAVSILAEVPTGALADRYSRRGALVVAGVAQALGYVCWILLPGFPGFAAGFVLWGLGGALISGAREALLYDGLSAAGAQRQYATVNGWVVAAGLAAELPSAVLATVLFAVGGFTLVGWASVGVCLGAALVASQLPEPPRVVDNPGPHDHFGDRGDPGEPGVPGDPGAPGGFDDLGFPGDLGDSHDLGYLATLRAGISEAATRPALRGVLVAAALLGGFDALEEYFPLITAGQGIPTGAVPLAMLPIGLAGALGAALAGAANRLRNLSLAFVLAGSMLLLGAAGPTRNPIGIVAVALFYGLYRAVLAVVDARLQARVRSGSRATVTSVAGLGVDFASFGLYAAWSLGEVRLVAALGAVIAASLPYLLRALPYKGPRTSRRVRVRP